MNHATSGTDVSSSCNDSLKMSVIRLDRNVSKNRRYLGFSKQRRALDGRDTGNESKRTGQIADHKADREKRASGR